MEQAGSDILLFNRVKQDDRLALNTLFACYYQKLCQFACTFSLSYEQAEEVVADVFFYLWKNRERLEIHVNFKAYVYKAVKHGALAIIKAKLPVIELSDEHDAEDTSNPSLVMDFEELQQFLDAVVNDLPDKCKQIFVMSRYDGMKYKEISHILGLSEKTVENQLVKALDIVRLAVKKYQVRNSSPELVTLS